MYRSSAPQPCESHDARRSLHRIAAALSARDRLLLGDVQRSAHTRMRSLPTSSLSPAASDTLMAYDRAWPRARRSPRQGFDTQVDTLGRGHGQMRPFSDVTSLLIGQAVGCGDTRPDADSTLLLCRRPTIRRPIRKLRGTPPKTVSCGRVFGPPDRNAG